MWFPPALAPWEWNDFQNLHLDEGSNIKSSNGALIPASGNFDSEKRHSNPSESFIDDLDGIDGGVCSNELENRILRELIYAFQGIEGVMIRRKLKTRTAGAMKGFQSDPANPNSTEEGNTRNLHFPNVLHLFCQNYLMRGQKTCLSRGYYFHFRLRTRGYILWVHSGS